MLQTTPLQTLSVLAALAAFGLFYNGIIVDNLARHLPARYRATSFEVVGGVLVTCVGIGVIFGLEVMLGCLLCFAASGIPMIYGDIRRTEVLG